MKAAIALLAWASISLAAPPRRGDGGPRFGEVRAVVGQRAYLDKGRRHGLTAGASLGLERQGRLAGVCQVEWLADSAATCLAKGAQAGDRVQLRAPEPPPSPAPRPRPMPSPEELARRTAKATEAPFAKVRYRPVPGESGVKVARATLHHATWAAFGRAAGPFQRESLDLVLAGVELLPDLHAYGELTVWQWLRRPAAVRYRPELATHIFVRQAELSYEGLSWLTLSAGRTRPLYTPGLLALDGVQTGLKTEDGALAGGVFAGAQPDPISLTPGTRYWTSGLYLMKRWVGPASSTRWTHLTGRLAWVHRPQGGRAELQAFAHHRLTDGLSLTAEIVGSAGAQNAPALLDAARLDLGGRPLRALRTHLSTRYAGSVDSDFIPVGATAFGARTFHADSLIGWQPATFLLFDLTGTTAYDIDRRLNMVRVGAELGFPTLLAAGTLSIGHYEEAGWARGRSSYLQASVRPLPRSSLFSRLAWFVVQSGPGAEGLAGSELGLTLNAQVQVLSWLSIAGGFLGRVDPSPPRRFDPTEGAPPQRLGGIYGNLQLSGEL